MTEFIIFEMNIVAKATSLVKLSSRVAAPKYSAQFIQLKQNRIGFKLTKYARNIVTLNVSSQNSGVDHALIYDFFL